VPAAVPPAAAVPGADNLFARRAGLKGPKKN